MTVACCQSGSFSWYPCVTCWIMLVGSITPITSALTRRRSSSRDSRSAPSRATSVSIVKPGSNNSKSFHQECLRELWPDREWSTWKGLTCSTLPQRECLQQKACQSLLETVYSKETARAQEACTIDGCNCATMSTRAARHRQQNCFRATNDYQQLMVQTHLFNELADFSG